MIFEIFSIALFAIFYIALAIAWHRIIVRYAKYDNIELKIFAAVWPASFVITLIVGLVVNARKRNKTKEYGKQ